MVDLKIPLDDNFRKVLFCWDLVGGKGPKWIEQYLLSLGQKNCPKTLEKLSFSKEKSLRKQQKSTAALCVFRSNYKNYCSFHLGPFFTVRSRLKVTHLKFWLNKSYKSTMYFFFCENVSLTAVETLNSWGLWENGPLTSYLACRRYWNIRILKLQ